MKVYAVTPRGYCKGVIRAINLAKKTQDCKKPITILGMIVHNQYIVDALKDKNIRTLEKKGATRLELLKEVDSGTIIITAHGASDEVIKQAKKKGLDIIDATCPDVVKTHDLIKTYIKKGYQILYIGKAGHPESEGALSIDKQNIHFIQTKQDIDALPSDDPYIITNQTTMSLYDIYDICEYAKKVLKNVTIEKETCLATKVRQEAIATIPKDIDVVFIIGDPHSNNTKKLAKIAKEKANKTVYMIESVTDITLEMLKDKQYAAISSGASTPTYLTNQVIDYLTQFDSKNKATHPKPTIDLNKIL